MLIGALIILSVVLVVVAMSEARRLRLARAEVAHLRRQMQDRSTPHDVLAHEIRTPLTLIQGSAELLLEETPGPLTDAQRRFVDTINTNCQQAVAMAEDFLTQARIDHALFSLSLERVELRRLVRDLVQEIRRTSDTVIRLDNHGAPIRLDADARLIRQAIANTVTNAIRHAGPNATVTVAVSAADGTALLRISDDGAGMSPEQKAALFTPFATDSPLDAPARQGVGLGMMVTRTIIELHGGRVLVDTMAAHGTTILLSLPLGNPAQARTASEGTMSGHGRN